MPAPTPSSLRRDRLIGTACALLVVLIWSSFSVASRFSARAGDGVRLLPWDLAALRFGVSGMAALLLWLGGQGRGLPRGRGLVLALLAGFGFGVPSYVGFTMAPAAHGALILSGTLPFLVAVGSRLAFAERWSRVRRCSLLLLLLGLGLFGTEAYVFHQAPPGAWRGDLCFAVASVSWAGYTLVARHWAPAPAQSVVAVGLWCGVLYLPVWALLLPSTLAHAPWREAAFQGVFQGLVAVLISLWLYTRAIAALGTARLTTITALVPGTAALLAVPLLHEPLGPMSLAGVVLVCVAVALGAGFARPPISPQDAAMPPASIRPNSHV